MPNSHPRLAALVLALAAVLHGCGGEADPATGTTRRHGRPPTTLYVNNGGEPGHLDPGLATDSGSFNLLYQLFEGLTTYHPADLHPIQGVAESWDRSPDGRRYRFHLRHDARWSDGRPVTARDFVYAWRRALRPATASGAAPVLYPLLNAEPFNLGQLAALRTGVRLRAAPGNDAPEVAPLARGTAVRITAGNRAPGSWVKVERHGRLPFLTTPPAGSDLTPPTGFVRAEDLEDDDTLLGVRAEGDHTLLVELERPTPYFLDLTSSTAFMPVREELIETFERAGRGELWTRPENILTNGPFAMASWRFRDEIALAKNPHYWNRGAVRTERLVFLEVESSTTVMNLYKAGEIDLFGENVSMPTPALALLDGKKDFLGFQTLVTYWYELDTRTPPLDDVRVRRALDIAIDKALLTRVVVKSGLPASHYVPDATGLGYADQAAADRAAGRDPFAGRDIDFDPERGRALLREAGYEVRETSEGWEAPNVPPIEILYNHGGGHDQIAVAVQEMWRRALGIRVLLRAEEWKVMLANRNKGAFQIVRGAWGADYNHPHSFLETFLSGSPQNHTGWSSPRFDAALREAQEAGDPAESMRLYRRAERIAVDGRARIPLYFFTDATLRKPYVFGYYGNARNIHPLQYAWIAPDWKERRSDEPAHPPLELPPPGRIDASP